MFVIDWRNLRSFNGSQNNAFEELCCQLAEYEKPAGSSFIRKGTPDAGVECFATLPDKTEWGWQAKYFFSMGNSQWSQLDDSVRTALEKHPRLVKYTVCIPLDRPDARIEGQESLLDKWHNRVEKWTNWAIDAGLLVQFEYWGSYQILKRLSLEEHRGRFFFWFGEEFFSQTWFEERLQESIEVAGPRYTPPIHVELPIAQLFDGLARTPEFFVRIKHRLRDIKKDYSWIHLQNLNEELATALDSCVQQLFTTVLSLDKSFIEPIPWSSVIEQTDQVLRTANECLEHLEELGRQARETKIEQDVKSSRYDEDQTFRNIRNYIYRFIGKVRDLRDFSNGTQAKLTNLPALLLCGEAGQGKTHLFCDIAGKRIAAGSPTILLMGQRFTKAEPWTQIMHQLGLPDTNSRDDLLGALQAAAQSRSTKSLIMIDALNEGEGKKIWLAHLPAMLQTLARYPWISVAVSVRSSYEHVVIAEGVVDKKLVRAEHHGFAEHEYQATRTFFDYYGIEQPSVPLLVPEFQNPLFLKLLCKGLHEDNQSKLPVGLQGMTAIFRLFVDTVNKKLSGADFCDFNPRRPIVWQAIDHLAETMADQQVDWLPLEEAEHIVNRILSGHGYENSLYRHLVSEGVLVENRRYLGQDEWLEVVQFAHEKFSDHIIVKHLLDKHLDVNSPEQAFAPDQPLAFLTEDKWQYNRGLIEALCIQVPERVGRELPEIVPIMLDSYSVGQGFIQSLIWRNPQAITDTTRQYFDEIVSRWPDADDQILNALLTVATNPEHPYNADFLHVRLMKDEIAERDAWWSIFLHYQYGVHNAVDRLVDWAWSPEDRSHIDDDSIRLCGIALTWFLTTSNRFLRDRATKALVNLFTHRINILIEVMEQFRNVNDPYVSERLYAVAYGCVLRSVNKTQIETLAQAVYGWVFENGPPPAYILLRDYARGVIEYALHRDIELDIEVDKFRPPYETAWLTNIPEQDAIEKYGSWREKMPDQEWSRVAIYSSVMEFGDFGRYVIEHDVNHWTSLQLDEARWLSFEERLQEFVDSLTEKQRKKWEQYQEARQRRQEYWGVMQRALEKLTDDELQVIIESDKASDNSETTRNEQDNQTDTEIETVNPEIATAEQRLRRTLGKKKLQIFENEVIPYLGGPISRDRPPQFDLAVARRWIVQRVFELGWTVGRFGGFDRHLDRNNFREARKAERVGKKYQWIAYYEFLARLADNYQYREQYSYNPQSREYNGSWQLWLRDIDPSCGLRKTGSSRRRTTSAWWFPTEYRDWDTISEDVEWMNTVSDLPDIQSLIEVTRPDNDSNWLALGGYYHWEQSTPPEEYRSNVTRREIWYKLRGYLVHQADCDEVFEWATQYNFEGRWIPEGQDFYQVYLGEFFWSPAYTYYTESYEGSIGWQGGDPDSQLPKPILPLVGTYMKEESGFDCSIDEGISITVPTQLVAEGMGLDWRGIEGKYFDKTGRLIAFDPSVDEYGPRTVLILKNAFLTFLRENEYCIVWTVLGEKQLVGRHIRQDDWKGRLKISGAYCWRNHQLEGKITPRFRAPQD